MQICDEGALDLLAGINGEAFIRMLREQEGY